MAEMAKKWYVRIPMNNGHFTQTKPFDTKAEAVGFAVQGLITELADDYAGQVVTVTITASTD